MSDQTLLPDYISKDFSTLREQLLARLAAVTGRKVTDISESEVSVALLELFASIADMMSYYIDSTALEAALPTARQPRSIYRLTKLINYKIRELRSATGYVKFLVPTPVPAGSPIVIPAGTRLSGGNLEFRTLETAVIAEGETESALVEIIQGQKSGFVYPSTGEPNQAVNIPETNIDPDTIEVWSGSIKWSAVDTLLFSGPTDYHYVVETDYNGVTTILFGDGAYGRLPSPGEEIKVNYLLSEGARGNLPSGAVSSITDPLGVNGLSVTNPEPLQGGDSREDLNRVKELAPASLFALNRALTKADYETLITENFGSIVHIRVWGEQEENPPNYWCMNWVNISISIENENAPPDLIGPTQSLKDQIREFLEDYQPITVRVRFIEPELIYVKLAITIGVEEGRLLSEVQSSVLSALQQAFEFEHVGFGIDIRPSDIYKIINAVPGVEWARITEMLPVDSDGNTFISPIPDPPVTDIVCKRWEIPRLYSEVSVTTERAQDVPVPDLYDKDWCEYIPDVGGD